MTNLFADVDTRTHQFGELYYKPKLQIKINTFFNLLGFKKLKNLHLRQYVNIDTTLENELTVYFFTYLQGDNLQSGNSQILKDYLENKLGIDGQLTDNASYTYPKEVELLKAFDNDCIVLGAYFKDSNIFFIPFDFFHDCNNKYSEKTYTKLLEILAKSIIKANMKFKKVDIREAKIKAVLKNLKGSLIQKVRDAENSIKYFENNIVTARNNLISNYNSRRESIATFEAISKLNESFDTEIINNIKEIEKLPFVKSCELDENGINVNVGKITYTGDLGREKKKVYLGEFTFTINGKTVEIKNKDSIKNERGLEILHFHITREHTCWGEWEDKIIQLIHNYKYKDAVFLVYTFLKSYNKDDKHCSFERFVGFREAEGKFDAEGNLLQKTLKEAIK